MSGGTSPKGRWMLLGASAFLSAAAVIGAFVPAPHSGGDNAGYVSLAYSLLANGSYTEVFDPAGLPHTKYPPVFPALLALLMAAGVRTWVGLKSVALVSTVAATAFTWLWAERRLGAFGAFAVAVLLSLSSAVVYYSHWVLSDPTFVAFTMAALWALDRADEADAQRRWLVIGVLAAGLAYFTRSAGLPLFVAVLGWLALRKRWRTLAVVGFALGVPAVAWWLRGRGVGVAEYGAEFWLADPYDPGLGRVSLGGLASRVTANAVGYVTAHIPAGIVGVRSPAVALLGISLTVASLFGWMRAARKRLGPAELFLPMYAGLILLWPQVWSGDRFALPLYPLFFVFAALAIKEVGARLGSAGGRAVAAVAFVVVLLPEGGAWLNAGREASACAAAVRAAGPWACYGPGIRAFAAAAEWMGYALPEGSVVMSRKPRFLYVLSGVPSRTFPYDDDPAVQLTQADVLGARYVLIDEWDGQAVRFVGGAIQRYPQAFCGLQDFGASEGGGFGTRLLGFKPAADRRGADSSSPTAVRIDLCPADYTRNVTEAYSPSSSPRIPLLDRLDP